MLDMVITTVSNANVPVHSSFTWTECSAFHKTHFFAAPNLSPCILHTGTNASDSGRWQRRIKEICFEKALE